MASLSNIDGKWMIQFPAGPRTRRRKSLRLGRVSKKDATAIREHVDEILNARFSRQPVPARTAAWLAEVDAKLHTRLVKAGLAEVRGDETSRELAAFLDSYIARRTDLKERTIANLKQVRRLLCERFTPQRDIATITRSQMKDWHRWLQLKLADATVAMHVKKARQFFAEAIDARLITDSPMKGIKAGSQHNESRMVYVGRDDIASVVAGVNDPEWQLVFALARYQGMRVPSETNRLTWKDVDFATARLTIHASKTEHHKDKGVRVMPIVPETMPHLWAAKLRAEAGERRVIVHRRGANLRTKAEKHVERAGLKPWEKMFQNLRASCETDLVRDHGIKAACKWIGNTEAVAMRHYLMVTDADFDRATGRAAKSAATDADSWRKLGQSEMQKPPEIRGFSQNRYPQGESVNTQNPMRIPKLPSKALRKALQRRGVTPFRGKPFRRRRLARHARIEEGRVAS